MSGTKSTVRSMVLLGGLGLALGMTGCAHVGEEDLESELAQIREEMEQGDQENAQQIDQVRQSVDDLESQLTSLEEDLQALEGEFNTTVQRLESALRFSTPIHFAFDAAEVQQEDEEYLDQFASVMQEYYDGATITVEGFTDPAGSEAYNQQLGQERADAVRSYLVENTGMPGDRIRTVSYGESTDRLIAPQAAGPDEGRSNRRVVLVVDYAPDSEGDSGTVAEGPRS